MSTAGLIFAGLMTLISVVILAQPLLRRAGATPDSVQHTRARLAAEYERVLTVIRDLDDDYALGKITPDVYARERGQWSRQGVALLQALDAAAPPEHPARKAKRIVSTHPPQESAEQALDDAVEQAVAAYVKATTSGTGN